MTDLHIPASAPSRGFYYHYKHDANQGVTHMAYEIVSIGWHTETGEYEVLYRPLYADSQAFTAGKITYVRPLDMFVDTVEKAEYTGSRFTKIDDAGLIEQLTAIRQQMYG